MRYLVSCSNPSDTYRIWEISLRVKVDTPDQYGSYDTVSCVIYRSPGVAIQSNMSFGVNNLKLFESKERGDLSSGEHEVWN
jgi:hypothetical protein